MEEELVIKCGKNTDSLEKLETMCKAEAEKLLPSIEVKDEEVSVACMTNGPGFAELIGVVYFTKDANGNVVYEFDDSESTL
jgi:hypothetical protein